MPVKLRHLPGVVLLAAAPFAGAQSQLPDPPAPAVIGRPLDQIRPARPVRAAPQEAKPGRPAAAVTGAHLASVRPAAPGPVAPAAAVPATPAPQPVAKQALASESRRAATHVVLGAHFSSRDQALVRRYYATQPGPGRAADWKVGGLVPPGAQLSGVPADLRAVLPLLPPGLQYVQLDGEVVLVAVETRRVVDGVSRSVR